MATNKHLTRDQQEHRERFQHAHVMSYYIEATVMGRRILVEGYDSLERAHIARSRRAASEAATVVDRNGNVMKEQQTT